MTEVELKQLASDVKYIKESLTVINDNIGQLLKLFSDDAEFKRIEKLKSTLRV